MNVDRVSTDQHERRCKGSVDPLLTSFWTPSALTATHDQTVYECSRAPGALSDLANAAAELDRFSGDPGPLLTVHDGVDVEV